MTYQSPTLYIVAIILVSIVGTGFVWSYNETMADTTPTPSIIHHPTVLGASTIAPTVTPLANELPSALLPSDVNRLFLEFCHRPARLTEMDFWTGAAPASLTSSFANIPNCI